MRKSLGVVTGLLCLIAGTQSPTQAGYWTVEDAGSNLHIGPSFASGIMTGLERVYASSDTVFLGDNFEFRSNVFANINLGYSGPTSFDFGESHLHKARLIWHEDYPGEPVPSGVWCVIGIKNEYISAYGMVSGRSQAKASVKSAAVNLQGNMSPMQGFSAVSTEPVSFVYVSAPAPPPGSLGGQPIPLPVVLLADGRWGTDLLAEGGIKFEHHGLLIKNQGPFAAARTDATLSSRVISVADTNGTLQFWPMTW